jgi:putative flippase GtrA
MIGPEPPPRARLARSAGFLVRYGIAGGASALTHLGTTWLLVEMAAIRPVLATNVGFALSIAVSYLLQRSWVFRSSRRHVQALPRFLIVVAISGLSNVTIVAVGTEVLDVHYLPVQIVALVAIPIINITLNATWTFRERSVE